VINDHAIYLRYQADMAGLAGSYHEIHLLVGKTQLELKADSFEDVPQAGEFEPDGKAETPIKVEARLLKLASQIRAYDDAEKAGPGFCLGQVVIDSDHDEESSRVSFSMPKYPDLSFTSYSKALTPYDPQETLLGRMEKVSGQYAVDILRKGETTLGGMRAQEWLASGVNGHDNKVLSFAVESTRPDPAFTRPLMSFSLDTGGQLRRSRTYVNSSFTPGEGIALWDAIIKSVRPRPNAVAPHSTDKSAQ
jgi:hypothetical protein